jgi:autotransporter-associated beta strand protein
MVAVAVFTVAASPASAATYSWLAKSGTGDWTTASNWNLNSSYPGADAVNLDVAQFNGDLTGPLGANLDTSVSIASLFLGDMVQDGVNWNPTTVSTTNASTLRFVTTGTAIISLVGANSAGTENLIAPDIFINAPTLEFRNNLTSGGGANGRGNLALTGNVTSGTTGNHIIRVTPAGNTTNTCYWDFRGNITDGPGVVSFFFRKDGTSGSSATRTLKLTGTGNTFSGGINFTGGAGAIIESSPASGTTGALGTGLITAITSSNATLNLGGSLSAVTEVAGINIGAGTKRIANIGAGHRILSGTVNQASGQPLTLACSDAGNLTLSNVISGNGPITISSTGSGKVIFSGNNTNTGATTVTAGVFQLDGSLNAASVLSLGAAGILAGSGTASGTATIGGGILSPGSTTGVLTLGSLALSSTSTTLIDLLSPGVRGTNYDGLTILNAGGLTYGGTMSLAFGGSVLPDNTTFNVFNFTGSPSGGFGQVLSTGYYAGTWTNNLDGTYSLAKDAQTLTFAQSTGIVTIVPEPTSVVAVLSGIALTVICHRRRVGRSDQGGI